MHALGAVDIVRSSQFALRDVGKPLQVFELLAHCRCLPARPPCSSQERIADAEPKHSGGAKLCSQKNVALISGHGSPARAKANTAARSLEMMAASRPSWGDRPNSIHEASAAAKISGASCSGSPRVLSCGTMHKLRADDFNEG